ncbi:MAG: butyrate kinase [Paracoccus sp. (in: a-proteobacteria)]|uniref:butyrate kinase n=1 Tax=Paracoccus sp. TaxID=267 RepID=UPI0026E0E290|nr:butyrate kinase [Paracoccus sp. (in: a-proteobacteria)]MDO5630207.1 butyrate kinase [Paracoccus sp. (in: a-proteobacteria)]
MILTINPGTTTTRLGLFDPDGTALAEDTLDHDERVMAGFDSIKAQLPFRAQAIAGWLAQHNAPLIAVAGRGGMLTPVPAGVIAVNDELVDFALNRPVHHHASNLGAPLAQRIAADAGCPAFVVDPVSVDELPPEARLSGCPELPRFSFVHALNIRACGRQLADDLGKPFDHLNAVIAHMGAGISIAAIRAGRIVESSNRMEISPFSPERAGGLPPMSLIDLCYSGAYDKATLKRKLYGQGGVFAYLGTKDMRRVQTMIDAGDTRAALVWRAMVLQIARAIGAVAASVDFRPDGIVLTGGMAHSRQLTDALTARCGALGPVTIMPGSRESQALAQGAARVLAGTEQPRYWPVTPEIEALPW